MYKPVDGYVLNPMQNYPRNSKCFCGSGGKFKYCCLSRIERYIPEARAGAAKELVEMAKRGVDIAGMLAKQAKRA